MGQQVARKSPVENLVQPHALRFKPYVAVDPPEVVAEQLGLPVERIIKLDGNENPYGPSPRVREALATSSRYSTYPDPLQRNARRALAAYANVDQEWIVAGAGSDELIELLMRLCVGAGDKVVDLPPTFGFYGAATRVQGGISVPVPRDALFDVDVEAVRRAIDSRAKLIFLANPNNPTGNLCSKSTILELLDTGLLVVVDETYHEFCGFTACDLVAEHENLVILRTFSKWAGLAGLRLGYAITAPKLARLLMAIKSPYNLSVASETALVATLEDTDVLLQRVRTLVEERERLASLLWRLPGVSCFPSKANFILCRFHRAPAPWVSEQLRRRGILVRYFETPPVQDCLRITVGKPEHTDALVAALTEILKETK
ncbi:MAG: histidinol-phosphate transaminase [Chloroflexi bacterium]|nr:histidinol-phosphate transaminase [Chloroflexota bacterium]